MHKPLFFIGHGEDLHLQASSCLDERLHPASSIDWYQGIKDSGRWSEEYLRFDKIQDFESSEKILRRLLDQSEKSSKDWIQKGIEKLDSDFESALIDFHIGASDSPCHIFDLTNWGYDFVHSNKGLDEIVKYAKKQKQELSVVGFDVHY